MSYQFKSDTPISLPADSSNFNLDVNLNGFGWDNAEGLFIPVDDKVEYFSTPYLKSDIRKIPNG